MIRKFISIVLIFLLITSVSIPAVNAQAPAVVAAPAMAKLVIDGVTIILTSAVVIEIGKNIGKTWDGVAENWDKFVKDVSTGIDN